MATEVTNIWTAFHKELKAFIHNNKTRNQTDTDDSLQEVFIKIIRNIDKVGQAENLRHYLYGIVRNAINDYFKNRQQIIDNTEIEEKISEEETPNFEHKAFHRDDVSGNGRYPAKPDRQTCDRHRL